MTFRTNGRGTLAIKRYYRNVGLIRRSSGTSNPETLTAILVAMQQLHDEGRLDILERIRDGELKPIDVFRYRWVDYDELPPQEPRPLRIYVIQAQSSGNLKIGITNDPPFRLKQLQTSNWETLKILLDAPGSPDEERKVHRKFRKHRIAREWFRPAPEILAWVEEGNAALEEYRRSLA